jgi:hypothetical protein
MTGKERYDWLFEVTGKKSDHRKKLANNTYAERRGFRVYDAQPDNGESEERPRIAIRLHGTDILTFWPDGSFRVNNGGWSTMTTHQRINDYIPDGWVVYGRIENGRTSGEAYSMLRKYSESRWEGGEDVREITSFAGGVTVLADGKVEGGTNPDNRKESEAIFKRERGRHSRWRLPDYKDVDE